MDNVQGQKLILKEATRLWVLNPEMDSDGQYTVWWPVNNPPWMLCEAGTVLEVTWASIVDGMVLIIELKDQDGIFVGFDVDEPLDGERVFSDLFDIAPCPVPCKEVVG
jgi:hypothetical protein